MQALTPAQERAVKWYIGDTNGDDPFWGDAKAYVTVNSLFFPGIAAEDARAAEGKPLNPEILLEEARLFEVLSDLLSAFTPLHAPMTTYRVERFADFEVMRKAARTLSFTSTSTAGFLRAYQDRVGIALMRFSLPAGAPCIPMAQLLPDYAKAEEAEVLLPPGQMLRIEERPLTPEERTILDAGGAPPVISVTAVPCGRALLPDAPAVPGGNLAGMRVLASLMRREPPDAEDAAEYAAWKAGFVGRLLADWV